LVPSDDGAQWSVSGESVLATHHARIEVFSPIHFEVGIGFAVRRW
jgi:hypothetical protein